LVYTFTPLPVVPLAASLICEGDVIADLPANRAAGTR
jgi:hypothetical protein